MSKFFSRLSYSFGNEDWNTEQQALKIKTGDRAVCITASGDRPLHLLLDDCQEVVSLDANPIQNHLLSLKMAAIKNLNYDRYISFLGAATDPHRSECLQSLISDMHSEASQYWLLNEKLINKGVIYQGAVEQRVRRAAALIQLLGRDKIQRLFEMDELEHQQAFVKQEWDRFLWRKAVEIALSPMFSRIFLQDPGLYRHVDPSINAGSYIYQRIIDGLMRCLARKNAFLSLFLKGEVTKEAFPPYLEEPSFKVMKNRLNRIQYHTADLISYLETAPPKSFDVFSLSDVASYINAEDFKRLMHGVHRTARPGARFCIREFLSRHAIPKPLQTHFKRDRDLENRLEKEDRCFVYRFMAGTIQE